MDAMLRFLGNDLIWFLAWTLKLSGGVLGPRNDFFSSFDGPNWTHLDPCADKVEEALAPKKTRVSFRFMKASERKPIIDTQPEHIRGTQTVWI